MSLLGWTILNAVIMLPLWVWLYFVLVYQVSDWRWLRRERRKLREDKTDVEDDVYRGQP